MIKNGYKKICKISISLADSCIFIQNGTLLPTGISFPFFIDIWVNFYVIAFKYWRNSKASSGSWYSNLPMSRSSISRRPKRLGPAKLSPTRFTPQESASLCLRALRAVSSSTMKRPLLRSNSLRKASHCSYLVWRQNFMASTTITPQSSRNHSGCWR